MAALLPANLPDLSSTADSSIASVFALCVCFFCLTPEQMHFLYFLDHLSLSSLLAIYSTNFPISSDVNARFLSLSSAQSWPQPSADPAAHPSTFFFLIRSFRFFLSFAFKFSLVWIRQDKVHCKKRQAGGRPARRTTRPILFFLASNLDN